MSRAGRITTEEYRALAAAGAKRPWSSARRTRGCLDCGMHDEPRKGFVQGSVCSACKGPLVGFDSAMEARVHARLLRERAPGETLFRQASFPLLSIDPGKDGRALVFTPDFVIASDLLGAWRVVEAKGARRSRDYELRRRAFERTYRMKVEEVDR